MSIFVIFIVNFFVRMNLLFLFIGKDDFSRSNYSRVFDVVIGEFEIIEFMVNVNNVYETF